MKEAQKSVGHFISEFYRNNATDPSILINAVVGEAIKGKFFGIVNSPAGPYRLVKVSFGVLSKEGFVLNPLLADVLFWWAEGRLWIVPDTCLITGTDTPAGGRLTVLDIDRRGEFIELKRTMKISDLREFIQSRIVAGKLEGK